MDIRWTSEGYRDVEDISISFKVLLFLCAGFTPSWVEIVRHVDEIQYSAYDEVHHVVYGLGFRVECRHRGENDGSGL